MHFLQLLLRSVVTPLVVIAALLCFLVMTQLLLSLQVVVTFDVVPYVVNSVIMGLLCLKESQSLMEIFNELFQRKLTSNVPSNAFNLTFENIILR